MRRASKSHRPLAVAVGRAWAGVGPWLTLSVTVDTGGCGSTLSGSTGQPTPAPARRASLPQHPSGAEQRGVNRSFPIQTRRPQETATRLRASRLTAENGRRPNDYGEHATKYQQDTT